jgi:hypothetical protein
LLWDQAARSGPDDFEGKLVDPAAHGYDKNWKGYRCLALEYPKIGMVG